MLAEDHLDIASYFSQPGTELLGIADSGRQRDQPDPWGQAEDDLFPNRAPKSIGETVDLVQHHMAQPRQGPGTQIDHIAQHFPCLACSKLHGQEPVTKERRWMAFIGGIWSNFSFHVA